MAARTGQLRPELRQNEELPIGDTPFEFLDPCCQKEILNESHHKRVGSKLRESDRSQVRLDERDRVLGNVHVCQRHRHANCGCGDEARDYPLLSQFREARFTNAIDIAIEEFSHDSESDGEELDSDDEALLQGLDESVGLTEDEQERMLASRQAADARARALRMGYGVHIEATTDHILKTAGQYGETVVCHIYQPTMARCALLDLALEQLASENLGTRFRRMQAHQEVREPLEKLCRGVVANADSANGDQRAEQGGDNANTRRVREALSSSKPLLLCVRGGAVTVVETNLDQCGTADEMFLPDLRSYLDKAHVLHNSTEDGMSVRDVGRLRQRMQQLQGDSSDSEADDRVEGEFCNLPGCSKRFHHSHVGIDGGASLVHLEGEHGREALG